MMGTAGPSRRGEDETGMSTRNGPRSLDERIVVTGLGAVTPIGLTVPEYWDGLLRGRNGIGPITLFDPERFAVQIAAQVKNFDPVPHLGKKHAHRMDRFSHFAVVASQEALASAHLQVTDENSARVGVYMGTGMGGITTTNEQFKIMQERGPDRLSPFTVPMLLPNMASGHVSIVVQARGPNMAPTSACSSAADAIGLAADTLRRGAADVMIAGGTEAPICEISVAGFHAARALSTRNDDPEHASRPFDLTRDGFVMGEGSGALVLERAEYALRRDAPILAELAGYGSVGDAYHITQPAEDGAGGARTMTLALQDAGLPPSAVDYINAHGTSTPLNDKFETVAIKHVFGESAFSIPVSSTKSMTGHLMGAAGAIEAIACIQSIREGTVPPTINLSCADPECDLDYVPGTVRPHAVRVALSNSMGFGGHNSCLVFQRWEP